METDVIKREILAWIMAIAFSPIWIPIFIVKISWDIADGAREALGGYLFDE